MFQLHEGPCQGSHHRLGLGFRPQRPFRRQGRGSGNGELAYGAAVERAFPQQHRRQAGPRQTLAEIGMPKEIVMRHRTPQFGHIFSSDGYSAARIEEEVVITENGPVVITKFPADTLVVANPY